LVVSSGPPQVAVPNVVGLTQAAATTAITNANLIVGTVATQSSTTVPSGSVISQNPTSGTQAVVGSAVNLVVSSGPPQVAVPNVVGLTQAAATTAIVNANLVLGTVTTQSSTTVPSGSVISQNPTSGTQVATGSAVNLVVSSGPPQVAVPNVVGLTQAAATTAITNANLIVGTVTTQSSTTVPSGSVISQNPTSGTQAVVGSAVNLVVSSGPPQVAVPNVVGLTQAAATTAITNANLIVGTVTTQSSTTVPSGSVISQNPTSGTQAVVGSAVDLVVSSGVPGQILVPDVTGLSQAQATVAITNTGLILGTVTVASSATVPAGMVISSTPAAGTAVALGSAVALTVSSGPSLITVPSVVGLTQAAATTAITSGNFTLGTVTLASSTIVPAGTVMSQSPAAATMMASGSPVSLIVSSGQPAGSPQMDVNVSVDGSGKVTTAPFSTTAGGELLVAFVSSDGPATGVQTSTVSGGGLTWTLVRRAVTEVGDAEVWTATAPATLVNATVSSTQSNVSGGPFHQSLTVVSFTGAAIGSIVSGSGGRNLPNLTISGTVSGSLVFAVGFDSDQPTARTLLPGNSMVHQWVDTTRNCTMWVQAFTDPMQFGDFAPVGFSQPNRDPWNLVAVEIVPH
ncbi:MAG TPA: PASTA domain-containing protein, partial [Vicinamibacterales bacterium]|nr:PASTA domain-containing protein [Vicinamibacterales bacterium]